MFFFPRDPLDLKLTMAKLRFRLIVSTGNLRPCRTPGDWPPLCRRQGSQLEVSESTKTYTGHGCPWLANGGGTGAQKSDK